MTLEPLTSSQRLIMEVVWNMDGDPSLLEILDVLTNEYHKEWKRQTVATFLRQIVVKGYLKMSRKGRKFYYHTMVDEWDFKMEDAERIINDWYMQSADYFLNLLMQKRKLTAKEVEGIKKLVEVE